MPVCFRFLSCLNTYTTAGRGHSLPQAQDSLKMLPAALQGKINPSESMQVVADLQEEAQLCPGGLQD